MNRKIIFALATCFVLSLVGCSNTSDETKPDTGQEEVSKSPEVKKFSYDGEEVGNGSFYVITASGSSEDGTVPVLYTTKDSITQIGIEGWDMDGSLKSYIYVDGILNTTEQLANTQCTLTINGSDFETGTYKVECVQYAENDENGEIVFYRSADLKIEID